MTARIPPRSRTETRAAVLEAMLRNKSLFRQDIAVLSRLSEASVSRILAELRSAGIITENRISAPYAGGPTGIIALRKDVGILGVELSNDRLSLGFGDLAGGLDYVERLPVNPRMDQASFERLFSASLRELAIWADSRGRDVRQAAMSLPGLMPAPGARGGEVNAILPWDMRRLRAFMAEALGPVPLAMTNSVIAQAAYLRYRQAQSYPPVGDHLFVFVGNGVAGVVVNEGATVDTFQPFELGHMIIDRGGAPCRCGHRGCLEAYTSLRAVAELVGVPPDEIISRGDPFLATTPLDPDRRAALADRLRLLGVGIGNALNLAWLPSVVVCGWPALMPAEDRAAILDGVGESLLCGGGEDGLRIEFVAPTIGNDPRAALAFASHAFARSGGTQAPCALAVPALH